VISLVGLSSVSGVKRIAHKGNQIAAGSDLQFPLADDGAARIGPTQRL
jgi:hypothetical protein